MAARGNGTPNGETGSTEIRLKAIELRLSHIEEAISKLDGKFDRLDVCVRSLETVAKTNAMRIDSNDAGLNRHEKDIKDLTREHNDDIQVLHNKVNAWSGINTFGVAIAGALAVIFGGKQ